MMTARWNAGNYAAVRTLVVSSTRSVPNHPSLADKGIRPGKICLENASVLAAPCEICLKPVARACREEADLGIDDIDADVTRTKPVPGIDLMLETAL
ncbi:hypothetical protein ACVMB3_005400 [Sinorhizobium meliloti]